MCKAPKPPKPKEPKKPQFLRNRYLDEFVGDAQAVKSLKSGRSSLRIPLAGPDTSTGNDTSPTPSGVAPVGPRVGARTVGRVTDPDTGRILGPNEHLR